MVSCSPPRRQITAIFQENITFHAFSAVCFACLFLLISATVYSVRSDDFRLNYFSATAIKTIIDTRLEKADSNSRDAAATPPEKAHEVPPRPSDNGEKAKELQLQGRPEKAHEVSSRPSENGEKANELKHKDRAEKEREVSPKLPDNGEKAKDLQDQEGAEALRHVHKTEKIEKLKHADDIRRFWKRMTPTPRELRCENISCSSNDPQRNMQSPVLNSSNSTCPFYFQWIYEDLTPWMEHGISLDMMEKAKLEAAFRVIISDGRLFVEPYRRCYQTRSLFTVWGLLQLLEYYPGLVPDVDIMFSCEDRPVVKKNSPEVPFPVFRYCSTKDFWDIPFPDWSFWGWSEINIAPWDQELSRIVEGSKKSRWAARKPVAYWKGNPFVAKIREKLLRCNSSEAEIFQQDWIQEGRTGFKGSNLADQCDHRYKIYVEGYGWSVSLKYILACNSPSLLITPQYHEFFSRGLEPKVSYWPVRYKNMCDSIKFAVSWGNKNAAKAERIGRAGQDFLVKQVSMKFVYDYMLHLLTQYAALLRFKPGEAITGMEICSPEILCSAPDNEKRLMQESRVKAPSSTAPCTLGPHEPDTLQKLQKLRRQRTRQIESWEDAAVGQPA